MLHKIEKFFETNYKHLGYNMKINGSNLSHVLVFMKTYIITNIENNKVALKKHMDIELYEIKKDLINHVLISDRR